MIMILSFWFIGYPQHEGKDKFLPASSWVWFSVSSTAIMMYLVGIVRSNLESGWLMLIAYVVFLFVILFAADFWRQKKLYFGLGWYSPGMHGLITIVLGTLLDFIFPSRMTTVALEFVVLLIFSLFSYSYSKYLVEYREEKTEAARFNTTA
jgi:hypothetical protein